MATEAAVRVDHLLHDLMAMTFPRAADGQVHASLEHHWMPIEWLWTPDRVLPLLLGVGGQLAYGLDVPLQVEEEAFTGFVLADKIPYSDAMVHAALGLVRWDQHELWVAGQATGRIGKHMDVRMWMWCATFYDVASRQGYAPKFFSAKLRRELPERIYTNPRIPFGGGEFR